MREEGTGHEDPQPMSGLEDLTGDQVVELQLIDLAGFEQFAAAARIAQAGALHIRARAHQVEGISLGPDVQDFDPEVEVGAIAGDEHLGGDRTGDLDVLRKGLGLEDEQRSPTG